MICRCSIKYSFVIPAKAGTQSGLFLYEKNYFVYILASKRNGTLYTGISSDLVKRISEHKSGAIEGFSKKYNVKSLVYVEAFSTPEEAIHREKCIKKWKRGWKIELIEGQKSSLERFISILIEVRVPTGSLLSQG